MSLRIIYGRAGTGKSSKIINEIKENIKDDNKKYIITPEQFSYSTEKSLLKSLEPKSVINAEVITFKRMAERIATEVEGKTEATLTKSGKAMIIYSILDGQKSKIKFFKSAENNVELNMQTIKEFKKHGITKEILTEAINQTKNQLLKTKLQDIDVIYTEYENLIKERFIDEEDILTKLARRLEKSEMFNGADIYIDEFSGFTKQEYDVIKQLLKKSKRLTITLCTETLEINDAKKETDIFYSNKKTANKLKNIAQELGVEIEEGDFLEENLKAQSQDLVHLEKNIYNIPFSIYEKEPQNIKLYLATNPYSQIEYIAKTIIKLVRDEGFRYRDIAIITKNIGENASLVKAILGKNRIPVFIDNKEDLSKNSLIKYILAILEIFAKNWSQEAVMSYVKSGFLDIEKDEIYKLENYTIKWGIRGNKWYNGDWQYEEENFNETRRIIVEPLLKLKKALDEEKTAISISSKLYEFLEQNNIKEKINKKIEIYLKKGNILLAKNYKTSFDILIDVIDEIVKIYKDERLTFAKYKEMLKIGLSYKELTNIPEVIDQVILGDIERTRSHKIKVAFIIGVNDGVFPTINKSEGFLNDLDREELKLLGKEIAKGTLDLLYEDQFNIYKALTTPEKSLYLLYASTDKDGKALRPSILISRIKKIFPKIQEQSDYMIEDIEITSKEATFQDLLKTIQKGEVNNEELNEIYSWYKNDKNWSKKLEKLLPALEYSNIPEKISKENIENLYGKKLKTSISKLETYKRCPFSFHLKYGLKLKEQQKFEVRTIDTGNFMHEVVEEFFKKTDDIHSVEHDYIAKLVDQIIEEKLMLKSYRIFTTSPKFIILTSRLKKLITKSIEYIVYQMQNSDFQVLSNELEFTKVIDNTEITGKIDRVDISKDGRYIRIIDYKSSSKSIDLNNVLAGIQIQLLTYMDIISEKQNKLPAGVLYFNLIEPIINEGKDLSEEEIEEKIKNEYRMKGLIVADIKVIKMMDKKLTKGYSDIIPVYIDKEGKASDTKSSIITQEEFTKLEIKLRKTVKDIVAQILKGNIDIKPIYDRKAKNVACKYCEYKTICGFNINTNCYEYIENKTKEEILNNL